MPSRRRATSSPTPPAATPSWWARRWSASAPTACSSARSTRSSTPASSWPSSARWTCPRRRGGRSRGATHTVCWESNRHRTVTGHAQPSTKRRTAMAFEQHAPAQAPAPARAPAPAPASARAPARAPVRAPTHRGWGEGEQRNRWWLVVAVGLIVFMVQLDGSIVTVALPAIQSDLHIRTSVSEWILLGYLLPVIALVLPSGRWLDKGGRQ